MGTPAYMSPEQALGRPTDPRSDVYSLGILLFELGVGRLPFPAQTITEAIRYHTQAAPPPPRSLRPDLPVSLEQVILKALEKDPARRFASAAELAGALSRIIPEATQVGGAPTAVETAVSLVTQLQPEKPPSRPPEFIPPEDSHLDLLQIQEKGKTVHPFKIQSHTITVGREPGNDIVLDDAKVSRNHLQITYNGTDYQVVDLNSTNGTTLGGVKLLPGVKVVWRSEVPLYVGDTWLRLVRAVKEDTRPSFIGKGTLEALSQFRTSPGTGKVGVLIEPVSLSVEPGSSVSATITLLNQSTTVDHFRLMLEGVAGWVSGLPSAIQLMPGEQKQVSISIQPPRNSNCRAGRYPIILRVNSQADPTQMAEYQTILSVGSFSQFSTLFHPQRVKANQPAQLTVHNQGNILETFAVSWKDPADELAFFPPVISLPIAEGNTAAVDFRVGLKKKRWFGRQQFHPFSAQVVPSKGGGQSLNGEMVSTGIIPVWLFPLLLLICLAGAALLAFWLPQRDSDGDGLSDGQEASLGTDPNKADTDGDGLTDGMEVNTYGTNPKDQDTDDDTLSDGYEVNQGCLNPLKEDTDGDGLLDNIDPQPCALPTPTSTPTLTPTATWTPTPTFTPTLTLTPQPTPFGGGAGFFAYVDPLDGEIYLASVDGIIQKNMTNNPAEKILGERARDFALDFSPDGKKLAFITERFGNINHGDIAYLDVQIGGINKLVEGWFIDSLSWSADGSRVIFSDAFNSGEYELFSIAPDSMVLERIQPGVYYKTNPQAVYSPDGKYIALIMFNDSEYPAVYYELYILDAQDLLPVYSDSILRAGEITNLDWSPDSIWIAYNLSSGVEGYDIYKVNIKSKESVRLTSDMGNELRPRWSPDGNWILYVDHNNRFYYIRADGTGKTLVPNLAGESPVWQP
jgi:Tol biopolymer transport system component